MQYTLALGILLLAGIRVTSAHQEALQNVKTIEQEVRAAEEAELRMQDDAPHVSSHALVQEDASLYVKWMTAQESRSPIGGVNQGEPVLALDIRHTWVDGDIAASTLTLTEPATDDGAAMSYRQTRFYRKTEQGWLRTQPDPALWGPPLTLETDRLIWRYRRRDHSAVAEIAGHMDALVGTLSRDYGLAHLEEGEKLTVNVQVDALPRLILMYDGPPGPIVVSSPSVHLVPVEWTDAEVLEQAVALALLKHLWAYAVEQHGIKESWPVMAGVSLWELWDMKLGLAEWQDEILHWLYAPAAAQLPARFRDLCAAHSIWIPTPIAVGIPLHCSSEDEGPRHNNLLLSGLKTNNPERLQMARWYYPGQGSVRLGDSIMMYTVVDYAVTAHGRERLPDLVAALGQYDTWQTLVPNVYGISYEEFERGWRQHLATLAQ